MCRWGVSIRRRAARCWGMRPVGLIWRRAGPWRRCWLRATTAGCCAATGWFRHGVVKMTGGQAQGLSGLIKEDRLENGLRVIELWHPLRAAVATGDALRLTAGCDKRSDTCRVKFANLLNFQGFPDIPGDDWSISDPMRAGSLNGGSRRA